MTETNPVILIVEDDDLLRRLVAKVLGRCGYTLLTAGSALEARGIWNERKADVDLVLCDLELGCGGNGHELGQTFRADSPELPVICMSGYPDHSCPFSSRMVAKPFSLPVLTGAVERALKPHTA